MGALIEVVICTHNNAALLERTLATLARQRTPAPVRWSVLVVDNASTDNTACVVDLAGTTGSIPGLRRVYEGEPGLVPARLRGVRETTAPWIAFVDDDCLLDEAWVANAAAFIEGHSECGAFGGIVRLDWESPPPQFIARYRYSFAEQEHGVAAVRREWLVGAGLILNREALERSGWLEKQYLSDRKGGMLLSGGDMEMVLRIRAAGYELWYTPQCVIRHYIPAKRTALSYLTRINFGLGVSQTWCDLLASGRSYGRFVAESVVEIARAYFKSAKQVIGTALGKRSAEDIRITFSFAHGRLAGLKQIARLNAGRRAEMLGCARPGITHVALLHWGDVIEDFLNEIDVSLEKFRDEMTGGWMFGFIEAMRSAGIQTTLFCISAQVDRVESWTHRPTGAAMCVIPASGSYRWLRRIAGRNQLLRDALPYTATPVRILRGELRKRNCEAVLCQEYEHARFDLSVLAGKGGGIPVFAVFQGGDTRFSRFERFFRRLAIRMSAGLIIGSGREMERVREMYRLSPPKVAAISNPLDLNLWYPEDRAAARQALHLPRDSALVLWHGRIDLWRKGIDILIEAWRQLTQQWPDPNCHLVLVGTGPDAAMLHGLIEAQSIPRVIWRDEYVLDRAVMRQYLSAADAYVFTSRHEGFPVAPLEAMACGLPIVAADCVGVRDIISQRSDGGIVVPLADAAATATALQTLLDDSTLRGEMGRQARKRVEDNFSLGAVGSQLKTFLNVPHLLPGEARA